MSREMVKSGIPWIGEIPKGWETKRLKNVGFLYGGLTGKSGDDFISEDDESCSYMRFIPFTNIFNNDVINPNQLYKVRIEEGEEQNLVCKNDILFLMSSEDYDGVGKPAIIEQEISNLGLNSFCKGFRITDNDIFPKFMFYKLNSHIMRELVRQEAKGFIRINLRQDKLSACQIFLPPLSEQQKIASFLDKKCAEVDEMVALQEKMIEDLKVYKQSVITEAVTKGLNPNAPMKDSGIEWIGEIPEHWEVKELKFALDGLCDGTHGTFERVNSGELLLSAKNISENGIVIGENESYISHKDYSTITSNGYPQKDDVLLCCVGSIGKCCIYREDKPIAFQRSVAFLRCNKNTSPLYLMFLLKSNILQAQYEMYARKSAQSGIYMGLIKEFIITSLPLEEQQQIADYLDDKCSAIDNLISIKQQKIEELKDYKKSIIYEYVTGKKEVEE